MTQRNNLHTADLSIGANAFAAASPGRGALPSSTDSNVHIANSTGRLRKAARIAVSLPIMVRDQFGGQYQARTQFVTVRGAVLTTTSTVRVGHKLTVQNLRSGKSAECHVTAMERAVREGHEVEVEFTRPQPDFWPVQFPAEESWPQETLASGSVAGNSIELDSARVEPSGLAGSISRFSEPESPKSAPHDEGLVVLGDSLASDFTPPPTLRPQTTFTPRTAPVDSVAQFRAANRAAHRREQAMKTFYSVLSIIVLAGLAFAAKGWVSRPSEITAKLSTVIPKSKPAPESNQTSKNSLRLVPVTDPREVKALTGSTQPESNSVAVAESAVSSEDASKHKNQQVAVRHGSSLASSRKPLTETDEEPLALPLHAEETGNTATKPELLSSVVGQAPIKTAVLAPPPSPVPTIAPPAAPKQVTPARLVLSTPAQYPSVARQLRTEGEVVIDVDVDASGSVSAAKAVSGPQVLRAAALDAVKRWKYAPATLGGKPVASAQTVKIAFHLK